MGTYRISFTVEEGYVFIVEAESSDEAQKKFDELRWEDVEKLTGESKHRWSDVCFFSIENM